jgi:4-hydroxybenzoate polyprenyltransferase/putative flippase GtrA
MMRENKFVRFVLTGGTSAVFNWSTARLVSPYVGLGAAVAIGYLIGVTTAYLLARRFVFTQSGRTARIEFIRFCLVNVVSFGIVWVVTIVLARRVFPAIGFSWRPEAIAHAIGIMSPTIPSYLMHRHFTFAPAARAAGPQTPEDVTSPIQDSTPMTPLAVDMDGTLLKTDILVEGFVAAFFARPFLTLSAVSRLRAGRAAFKQRIAELARLDVSTLPLRADLVDYLALEADRGRPLHLVSAADHGEAARVAQRVGLFRSVQGSTPGQNLKGGHKARALAASFPGGFVYAGDSAADLAVWRAASGIVLAGASPGVARAAHGLHPPVVRSFARTKRGPRLWMKALRIHQWSKNALMFAPLFLSGAFMHWPIVLRTALGFVIFGMVASATYIINDLSDLSSDRRHAVKHNRPFASGDLPLVQGLVAAPVILVLAVAAAMALSPAFAAWLCVYLLTTLAYSFRLKRIAFFDVFLVGWLFTVRLLMGIALAGAVQSAWLVAFSMMFFFAMAVAKRHVEVSQATPGQVIHGRGYRAEDAPLTLVLGVTSTLGSILILLNYLISDAFPSGVYRAPAFLWAAPVLMSLWVMRIWLLAHRGALDDDPVAFATRDRLSLAMGALLGLFFLAAVFL